MTGFRHLLSPLFSTSPPHSSTELREEWGTQVEMGATVFLEVRVQCSESSLLPRPRQTRVHSDWPSSSQENFLKGYKPSG